MKKLTFIPVVVIMLGTFSIYGQTPEELIGVWKMIYKKWELSDTVIERSEYTFPSYKIFYEDHFSLSRVDEEGQFIGHFGNFSFDGKTYIEHITFSSYEYLIGRTVEFKSNFEGDKWTIKGDIGTKDIKFELVEIWQRVD